MHSFEASRQPYAATFSKTFLINSSVATRTFTSNIWEKVATFSRLSSLPTLNQPASPPLPSARAFFRVRAGKSTSLSFKLDNVLLMRFFVHLVQIVFFFFTQLRMYIDILKVFVIVRYHSDCPMIYIFLNEYTYFLA